MAAVPTRDLFGFVHRAGTEQSSARVLAELSQLIGERLMAYRVTVYVIDGEHFVPLVSEYSSGVTDARRFASWRGERSLESSELAARLRAGERLLLIKNPEDVLPERLVGAFGIQPFVAVALRTETSLLGGLLVEGDYDDLVAQQSEISRLAGVVALVLETARTFERERERTRETEALLEVGAVLTESTEVTEVLAAVARNSARVCGFERCSILILDDSGHLVPVMSQFADGHIDLEMWETFRWIDADLPAAREVIESGAPAAYREAETVPELNPSVWLDPFGIKSILLVPLVAWEECFGVLVLDHRERHSIGPEQIRITEAVAAQGAAAIGISRLLEREEHSRRQAEVALADLGLREAQQAAVAAVSQLALTAPDLVTLMDEAVVVLAETLDVEYVKILELQPGGKELLLRAGVGWDDGLVGTATVGTGSDSHAGFTLSASSPVIVGDLAAERRFSGAELLTDHNVVSGLSVIIGGREEPYGVLGAHTIRKRTFTSEDIDFLRSVANVVASAIDQKRGERAVHDSEERYRSLFERSPIATWEQDFTAVGAWLDGLRDAGVTDLREHLTAQPEEVDHGIKLIGVLNANSASLDLIGAPSLDQLLEISLEEPHAVGIRESFITQFLAIWEHRDRVQFELVGRTVGGDRIDCVLHFAARRSDSQLELSRVIVALVDITERRAAEERLKELVRSKKELIASVSHEIRTPLTAILGFARLLQDDGTSFTEAEHAEMLQVLVSESTDIANIVEDLIVAAKSDIGKLHVMHVPVDLRAQAAQVLERWDESVTGHIQLSGETVRCIGDPARVRQVIRNLVSNALRYGGDNIRVAVGSRQSAGYVLLADDGPGVPPKDVERIFENYQRGAQSQGLTAALGLGLGISRHLARVMGGDVTYQHNDQETIFELTLPLALPTSTRTDTHRDTSVGNE